MEFNTVSAGKTGITTQIKDVLRKIVAAKVISRYILTNLFINMRLNLNIYPQKNVFQLSANTYFLFILLLLI